MGGLGSGRRWGSATRSTVEDSWVLEINTMKRKGAIVPSERLTGLWGWSIGGQQRASLYYATDLRDGVMPSVMLQYTVGRGEAARDLSYRVELVTSALPWGGVRYWFVCPLSVNGRACGRRVAKLYLPPGGDYYGCRHCYDLTYQSCRDSHKFDGLYALLAGDLGWDVGTVRETMRELEQRRAARAERRRSKRRKGG
jgi:hypothetical protein